MTDSLCLSVGRIVDPKNGLDAPGEVYIVGKRIAAVKTASSLLGVVPERVEQCITLPSALLVPGLIDLHVHFRDPGQTYKEDVHSGCQAAAAGGFTTVCMMPNTSPVIDSPQAVEALLHRQESINALPIASITRGQQGLELTDIAAVKESGACALSEDGRSVAHAALMLEAMKQAVQEDMPIFDHTEDDALKGTPEGEACMAARDILLAKATGARLHLCHISSRLSLDMIRTFKAAGYALSAETAPHYFTLDKEQATHGNFKMNPPLRTKEDVQSVIKALQDGTLDAIATDHAPHSTEEKACGYDKALNGVIGLESAFPVSYTKLVREGHLSLTRLIELMSLNPARILKKDRIGHLTPGAMADIALFDVERPYSIDPDTFLSRGRNTPFAGWLVYGKTLLTVAKGQIVYQDKESISL